MRKSKSNIQSGARSAKIFHVVAASIGLLMLNASAWALQDSCKSRSRDHGNIHDCMKIENLVNHLKAFQRFADQNKELPGTRFTSTDGENASRDYVINSMRNAGYVVTTQNVPLELGIITSPRTVTQTRPSSKNFLDNIDYAPVVNSGGGDVKGTVQLPSGDISGCAMSDFAGFQPGNIAMIQISGNCSRNVGVSHAIAAGAKAVMMNIPSYGVIYMHIESILSDTTPVLVISKEMMNEMKQSIAAGTPPELQINFKKMIRKTAGSQNIIAETRGGNPDRVVMVGAHLDSSHGNAGMNDNASSAAAILETALLMKDMTPVNKLRFAWWTGEELGLLGSNYYVEHLNSAEKDKIAVYLNYETLGAPNGGRMIMGTADGISSKGSEKVTAFFVDYFKSQGLKYFVFDPKMGDAARRSDMAAFMKAGIPIGYLATGAEIPWNPMLSAIFTDLKRVNGMAMHPCYHKLCDKLTLTGDELKDPNFDFDLYLQMSKAAANAAYSYSMKQAAL